MKSYVFSLFCVVFLRLIVMAEVVLDLITSLLHPSLSSSSDDDAPERIPILSSDDSAEEISNSDDVSGDSEVEFQRRK